jgi:FkbM family methyltransferase
MQYYLDKAQVVRRTYLGRDITNRLVDLVHKIDARRKRKLVRALADKCGRPIIYCDVGALWGVENDEINELNNSGRLQIIGFEPDPAECERLNALHSGRARFYSYCLGDKDGEQILCKTRFGACSSLLKPNRSLLAGFKPYRQLFEVEAEISTRCARFDTLQVAEKIPSVDFLKCDTQGFEYEVLSGFGESLKNVIGIELETHSKPLYDGQKLMSELVTFVTERGFILRDLRPTFPFEYDLFEFEAFFSRDPRAIPAVEKPFLALWQAVHEIPPGRSVRGNPEWPEWIRL